jgi:hypothetical protein
MGLDPDMLAPPAAAAAVVLEWQSWSTAPVRAQLLLSVPQDVK